MNTRLVGLQPLLLGNRLLWLVVGAAVLAFTYRRFRLAHPAERGRRARRAQGTRRVAGRRERSASVPLHRSSLSAPVAERRFGGATQWRQLLAVTGRSLRTLAKGWTVFAPLGVVAFLACVAVPAQHGMARRSVAAAHRACADAT